jgi:hypothetical protein
MKQIETLQLIRARCVELLEQAKLRTPGAWQHGGDGGEFNLDMVYRKPHSYGQAAGFSLAGSMSGITPEQAEIDATYIANASVAFEAALESTIAAIDNARIYPPNPNDNGTELLCSDHTEVNSIIAAWKHLLP